MQFPMATVKKNALYILKPKTLFLLVPNTYRIKLMIKTSKEVVFVLDKMNLKNSMIEFRQFQRIRKEKTLLKRNMSIFRNVRFQRGYNSPVDDVKVTVRQGLFPNLGVITFSATTGFKDHIEDASAFKTVGLIKPNYGLYLKPTRTSY
jgi:hypothetical protein